MPFIDIAIQADTSRYEDADFEEYARWNCGENPDTRDAAVEELKRLLEGWLLVSRNSVVTSSIHQEHIFARRWIFSISFRIADKGECRPRRKDDAYLLRFLRCRRFIPALAHQLVKDFFISFFLTYRFFS